MKVKLVYGCPCSGKSTYVAANASDGDLIYDYDALLSATTTQKQHLTSRHKAHFCLLELRQAFIDTAQRSGDIDCLWMQCRWPTDTLMKMLDGIETEQIFIKATKEECYAHLDADDSRPDKDEWRAVIDAWFDEHGKTESSEGGENKVMKKFWNWVREKDSNGKVVKNVLRLYGPIDEEIFWGDEITPDDFREELEAVDGDVELWINSPGGNVFAAAQIYNMLMEHKGNIYVHIDAIAASAASVVAMAGTVITMSPVAMMMIHNPSTIAWGDHNEMEKAIDVLSEVKESIINAYEIKTGLSRKEISKLMENETWMNALKAVELGFADEIAYAVNEDDDDEEEEDDDDAMNEINIGNLFSTKSYITNITNKLIAKYRVEPVVAAEPVPEAVPEQTTETEHEPEAEPEAEPIEEEPVIIEAKQYYDRLKEIKNKF